MGDFSFEIVEHIGVLSTSAKGWTKEINKVSFSGRPAKLLWYNKYINSEVKRTYKIVIL